MTDSFESLDSLTRHPGWRLFRDMVEREWGPSGAKYNAELDKALDLTDGDAAASQARQVRAGRKVIEMLVRWPDEEVSRLKRNAEKPEESQSRRGLL